MRLQICTTGTFKEGYRSILKKYDFGDELNLKLNEIVYFITIGSIEDLVDLTLKLKEYDNSELIMTTKIDGNVKLEIYNDYRGWR